MKSIVVKNHCLFDEQFSSEEPKIGDEVEIIKKDNNLGKQGVILEVDITSRHYFHDSSLYGIKFEDRKDILFYLAQSFKVL